MACPADITPAEISAAYRAAGLHRLRIGLAKALQTPSIYTALCNAARERRKQQNGQPAPTRRAIETETAT